MRGAFIQTLAALAEKDPRILLLTGDLGFMSIEPFSEKFPERFFNVGVSEQNMAGLATGLAESGFIPFIYSIATFASLRAYEFIRNGPILHQLPVRIVGIGGGFEYGPAGATHHALEDAGVMRVQPGISVIAPADFEQTRSCLMATWNLPGPVYYRIGKDDKTTVPGLGGRFDLGRTQTVREGRDLLILTMGSIAAEAVAAAKELAAKGIEAEVVVVASLNPAPTEDLAAALARFPVALAVEAHYVNGALGSLVCEVAAERALGCRVIRCGVRNTPDGVSGDQKFMHEACGISTRAIVQTALRENQPARI
jgi:transketolase